MTTRTTTSARVPRADRLGALFGIMAICAAACVIGTGIWTLHAVLNSKSPQRAVCASWAVHLRQSILRDSAVRRLRHESPDLFAARCQVPANLVSVAFGFQHVSAERLENRISATLQRYGWRQARCGYQKKIDGRPVAVVVRGYPDRSVRVQFSNESCSGSDR